MTDPGRPYGLLAELTYQCPLHCPYCSNPVDCPTGTALPAADWRRVLGEAAALGVLHVGFSGGEPLRHPDLATLVATAREEGLFSNLITSGVGLTEQRTGVLQTAGLDSVQISFQADEPALADQIAGARVHREKLAAAHRVRNSGMSLSLNVVLHRHNIGRVEEIIGLAEELGATRLELANTQFYGWAFRNRQSLLPARDQVLAAEAAAERARQRLRGSMEILYVLPDYYQERPKACMHGWGRRFLTVNPVGEVLPCPTAGAIPGLSFDNVRERSLDWIWRRSEAFNRFRGFAWMPEPCRSCEFRETDFGGCRCQAALLTGEAGRTDPVCGLSPDRALVDRILQETEATAPELVQRIYPS